MLRIAFCGCGALGSWVAMMLAGNLEFEAVLIDDDRIEDGNLATTPFYSHQIGTPKVMALGEMLFRKGVTSIPVNKTIQSPVEVTLFGAAIILDTFDNMESRALTVTPHTLHAGVSEGRTGAVLWGDRFQITESTPRGENPICTRHLGARILQLTALFAANSIRSARERGALINYPIVLEDGSILR